jgi:FkbM family methyltransferase
MVYESLLGSTRYDLSYQEIDIAHREIPVSYDFYVVNYHDSTSMEWLDTSCVRRLPGLKIAIVLEVAPNNPFVRVSPEDFDAYMVLDPTVARINSKVFPFPRPLEAGLANEALLSDTRPVIGTFGLPTKGKGFGRIVRAVNDEFDDAVIRMNIPSADYIPPADREAVQAVIEELRRTTKPGVELVVSRDYMSKQDLIRWCARNTLNVFLYDRAMPGLAATTDQAVSSGRPLAVSANDTFRHIHTYLIPYPFRTLKESIAVSAAEVARMQSDWSPASFQRTFEGLLEDFAPPSQDRRRDAGSFSLVVRPAKQPKMVRALRAIHARDLVPPVITRGLRYVRRGSNGRPRAQPQLLPTYASPLISSFSQHGEDLWLDLVLGGKSDGFYVDVGANHPQFNSNTCRFYRRGWSGINIEPTIKGHALFERMRPRDVNLQIAIAAVEGETTLYMLSNDTTLSTLDRSTAAQTAKHLGLEVVEGSVRTLPLSTVFREYGLRRQVDFMSVDAEGYDEQVLSTNDWDTYRPTFVLVEMNQNRNAIVHLLQTKDYALLINNGVNGLFVDAASHSPEVRRLVADRVRRES